MNFWILWAHFVFVYCWQIGLERRVEPQNSKSSILSWFADLSPPSSPVLDWHTAADRAKRNLLLGIGDYGKSGREQDGAYGI